MTFLITYPQDRIDKDLQDKLTQTEETIFLPLRKLREVELATENLQRLKEASYFVVTSPFALKLYLEKIVKLNPTATVLLFSEKMGQRLSNAGLTNFKVMAVKNESDLFAHLDEDTVQKTVFLRGNLTAQKTFPPALKQVVVYRNEWDEKMKQAAIDQLRGKQISCALVTSPSGFNRVLTIRQELPDSFKVTRFYALGEKTAQVIRQAGEVAHVVATRDVLRRTINKLVSDSKRLDPGD